LGWGLGRTSDDSPLPLEERFFLGGANSLRGFYRNQVGPANEVMWSDFDYPNQIDQAIDQGWRTSQSSRWIHTGGDVYGLVNLELHWPMSSIGFEAGTLVGFVDLGTLQFIASEVQTDSEVVSADPFFRYSVGVGMRYSTVIGPIVFDLGINPSRLTERNEVLLVPNISFGSF
jgi:outer membrane protein assembly factor BamA